MTDLARLLADCEAGGVRLAPAGGGKLGIDAPQDALTDDLLHRLKRHKAELLAVLEPAKALDEANLAPVAETGEPAENRPEVADGPDPWGMAIDPPEPCPGCGGLAVWWNPLGGRRCLRCEPPTRAIRVLERTERIRRRLRIPSPAGASEMLVELRRLAGRKKGS